MKSRVSTFGQYAISDQGGGGRAADKPRRRAHAATPVDPTAIETGSDFRQALAALRSRKGLSIRELSRATGIPSSTLGGYFGGRHLPTLTRPGVLKSLLGRLGVSSETELAHWLEALRRARRHERRNPSRTID